MQIVFFDGSFQIQDRGSDGNFVKTLFGLDRSSGAATFFGGATLGGGLALPWAEIGSSSVPGTSFLDFHSSGNNIDYDTRIIASGGSAAVGQGAIDIKAGGGFTKDGNKIFHAGDRDGGAKVIDLFYAGGMYASTTSTSATNNSVTLQDGQIINFQDDYRYFDAALFAGGRQAYFEAVLKVTAGATVYCGTKDGGAGVGISVEVSTASTSFVRVRSGAFLPNTSLDNWSWGMYVSGGTGYCLRASLIIM